MLSAFAQGNAADKPKAAKQGKLQSLTSSASANQKCAISEFFF